MKKLPLAISAPAQNLQRLLAVRGIYILTVCAALFFCRWQLQLPLNYSAMLFIISALTLINIAALIQLNYFRFPSTLTIFAQLVIELIGISLLLFYSGGADNPFISYYLVPLCIAAAILPWRFVWPLTLMALGFYTSLFFYRIPLPDLAPQQHHGGGFSLHTAGMWFNFLISSILITFFIVRMASALRSQNDTLNSLKEDRLRDEQLLAVATLAAGTAHELGSPLTTIKTLLHEMQSEHKNNAPLQQDIQLLQTQLSYCTETLQNLKEQAQKKDRNEETVAHYISQLLNNWLLLHPEVEVNIGIDDKSPDIEAYFHPSISQAIVNLLNNAAEANPTEIDAVISWDKQQLIISISDQGDGIDEKLLNQIGTPFISDKGRGRGLGLFLTKATLDRYNGTLTLTNNIGRGCRAVLTLPIDRTE